MTTDTRFRWLVTGGAGFLGVHLCRGLVDHDQDVTAYDISPLPSTENLTGVRAIKGDIRDSSALAQHLSGVDFVVHAAAALALAPADRNQSS